MLIDKYQVVYHKYTNLTGLIKLLCPITSLLGPY